MCVIIGDMSKKTIKIVGLRETESWNKDFEVGGRFTAESMDGAKRRIAEYERATKEGRHRRMIIIAGDTTTGVYQVLSGEQLVNSINTSQLYEPRDYSPEVQQFIDGAKDCVNS